MMPKIGVHPPPVASALPSYGNGGSNLRYVYENRPSLYPIPLADQGIPPSRRHRPEAHGRPCFGDSVAFLKQCSPLPAGIRRGSVARGEQAAASDQSGSYATQLSRDAKAQSQQERKIHIDERRKMRILDPPVRRLRSQAALGKTAYWRDHDTGREDLLRLFGTVASAAHDGHQALRALQVATDSQRLHVIHTPR